MQIKVWSRTIVDDSGMLSGFEYNGSFQASMIDWQKALIDKDLKQVASWVKMMDAFHNTIQFLNVETNEIIQFRNIYPHEFGI